MLQDYCDANGISDMAISFKKNGKVNKVIFEKSVSPEHDAYIEKFMRTIPPIDVSQMGMFNENRTYDLGFNTEAINHHMNSADIAEQKKKIEVKRAPQAKFLHKYLKV